MTYYDILEISETASDEVVKMAYKALAKKYHPDSFKGDPKEAEEKIKQINAAFDILSDKQKRMQYDNYLRDKRNKSQTQQGHTTSSNHSSKKKSYAKKEFSFPSSERSFWIISIQLCLCFIQAWHPYAESDLYKYSILLGTIDFCFINIIMMIIPMLVGNINTQITPNGIKNLCCTNSITIYCISLILYILEIIPAIFIGWIIAIFYYFINKHILLQIKKHNCNKKKTLTCTLTLLVILISVIIGIVASLNNLLVNDHLPQQNLTLSKKSTLVVAVEDDFAPFSYKTDTGYSGIHIDMAEEMAKRINCELKFVSVDYHELLDGIDKGDYDLAFGIGKTPQRMDATKNVMFTDPYYEEMAIAFNSESYSKYVTITSTLNAMIEDGTVKHIFSKYNVYLSSTQN